MAVDLLGDRHDLVFGEPAKGVLHHLKVVAQVAGAVGVGQRGEEVRCPVGGHKVPGAVERIGGDTPLGLPAEQLGTQLGQRIGDERGGNQALVVALGAIVEQPPAAHQRGGGVGDVVGQHLVGVDAVLGQPADGRVDDGLANIQGGSGGGEVGGDGGCGDVGHGAMLPSGSLLLPDAKPLPAHRSMPAK